MLGKEPCSSGPWLVFAGRVVVSMITREEYGTACEGDIVTQYEL